MREIHVTVPANQRSALRSWIARADDRLLGRLVHPNNVRVHHFLNLRPARLGPEIEDLMIGMDFGGNLHDAVKFASTIVVSMQAHDLAPCRAKVECPATEYPVSDEHGYYETHLRLLGVPWFTHAPQDLTRLVLLSRSVASGEWHGTVRSEGCSVLVHMDRVGKAARALLSHRVQVTDRPRHEYVEYDSRREHDAAWEGKRFTVKEPADGPQA